MGPSLAGKGGNDYSKKKKKGHQKNLQRAFRAQEVGEGGKMSTTIKGNGESFSQSLVKEKESEEGGRGFPLNEGLRMLGIG